MDKVRHGEIGWTKLDDLHRMALDHLPKEFNVTGVPEAGIDHLNRAWHRLDPWPDSVAGLIRLKKKYVLTTLSNGNVALMVNMAKRGGLPWDVILGASRRGTTSRSARHTSARPSTSASSRKS
jgi:2-haloacid dehalogenase